MDTSEWPVAAVFNFKSDTECEGRLSLRCHLQLRGEQQTAREVAPRPGAGAAGAAAGGGVVERGSFRNTVLIATLLV